MKRRLTLLIAYLELGRDEAQWLALLVAIGLVILAAAVILGLAARLFIGIGGF